MRGRYDEALGILEEAVVAGWRHYWWLLVEREPAFGPLRDDSRYEALLTKLKEPKSTNG